MGAKRIGLTLEQLKRLREKDRECYAACAAKQRERHKKYYAANRERVLAQKALRRRLEAETVRARGRAYYAANPEKHRAMSRESAQRHPDTHRRWKASNIERVREYCRRRQAKIRGSSVEPVDYALVWKESGGLCGICREPIRVFDERHFDHIVPLSAGGTHTRDNIQVAHARCNLAKGARVAA